MTTIVVQEWQLPVEEIRYWRWSRLLDAYRSVQREQWDSAMAESTRHELAFSRAIGAALGAKQLPSYPRFEDTHIDAFAPNGGKVSKRGSSGKPRWMEVFNEQNTRPDETGRS